MQQQSNQPQHPCPDRAMGMNRMKHVQHLGKNGREKTRIQDSLQLRQLGIKRGQPRLWDLLFKQPIKSPVRHCSKPLDASPTSKSHRCVTQVATGLKRNSLDAASQRESSQLAPQKKLILVDPLRFLKQNPLPNEEYQHLAIWVLWH